MLEPVGETWRVLVVALECRPAPRREAAYSRCPVWGGDDAETDGEKPVTETLDEYWPRVIPLLSIVLSALASAHAVMYKRESNSAATWVAVIWLSPFIGPALYVIVGINRIRRLATLQRGDIRWKHQGLPIRRDPDPHEDALERAIDQVAEFRREGGHLVEILENGDSAYPAMREAIARATSRVHLCTYIFDRDRAGLEFLARGRYR